MKAKPFLRLPLVKQGEYLHTKLANMNEDGSLIKPDDDFDEWAKDTLDVCVFPFPAGSPIEQITDTLIASMGMFDGMRYIRQAAVNYVRPVIDLIYEWAPLSSLADKLPD